MSNVEIKLTENCTVGSFVKIDGVQLNNVTGVNISADVGRRPKINIELTGHAELNIFAETYKTLVFEEEQLSTIGFRFRNLTGNRDALHNKTNADIGIAIVEAVTGNKVVIK